MPSLVLHIDTAFAGNPGRVPEALELRVSGVIYTLSPGVPTYVDVEHLAAVQAAVTAAGGTLATPAQPTVTNIGTAGATSYSYAVVAKNDQGDTPQSTVRQTTTGNATLTGSNFNRITWTAVSNTDQYKIIRTASSGTPSSTGIIGTVAAGTLTFDDTGIAAQAYTPSGTNPPNWGSSRIQVEV